MCRSRIQPRDQFDFLVAHTKLGWNLNAVGGIILTGNGEFDRYGHLPAWNERKGIFWKHVHQKRDVDTGCFGGGKRPMPVPVGGNQAFTLHYHPLIHIFGAVLLDPVHFAPSIPGRGLFGERSLLQTIRESQNLLLLRRR